MPGVTCLSERLNIMMRKEQGGHEPQTGQGKKHMVGSPLGVRGAKLAIE